MYLKTSRTKMRPYAISAMGELEATDVIIFLHNCCTAVSSWSGGRKRTKTRCA